MLLDRAELTSGSTFHSAGLVGQLRGSVVLTRMMMYSVELYRTLAASEIDPGWVECGGIRLACTPERDGGDPAPGRLGADVRPAAGADLAPTRRASASR